MKRIIAFLLFASPTFAQTIIPIQNPSFEASMPTYVDLCGLWSDSIPGWQSAPGAKLFQVAVPRNCGYNIPLPPDGKNVVYIGSSAISQDLNVKPSVLQAGGDGHYVLKFYVSNFFTVYPGYWEAKILSGQQELCSTDGWATRGFKLVTWECDVPSYLIYDQLLPGGAPADPNAHLFISFSSTKDGWPIMLDNVSLTFAPGS